MRAKQLVSLLAIAALVACQSTGPVHIGERSARPAAGDYEQILAEHTRRAHVYDWLDAVVDVRATYHSPAFKQAFAAARARFQGRAADRVEATLFGRALPKDPIEQFADVVRPFADSVPAGPDLSDAETFFVAMYVADQENRWLTHDSTIWEVALNVDGGPPVEPLRIESVRRTPSLDQVYPYLDKLDTPYVFYFAPTSADGRPLISSSTRSFTLRIVSKIADAKVTWQVAR
ncbi:MAG: hypothetical protein JXR83_16005 [Deltaproteobacteria bacterium]|nr:hypothetical protein [Deltaproteobacteria bacterium]